MPNKIPPSYPVSHEDRANMESILDVVLRRMTSHQTELTDLLHHIVARQTADQVVLAGLLKDILDAVTMPATRITGGALSFTRQDPPTNKGP